MFISPKLSRVAALRHLVPDSNREEIIFLYLPLSPEAARMLIRAKTVSASMLIRAKTVSS
ncbi:hypothetical protein Desaci_3455 [Desulfosporosinus acidiphilus SJ4]|uniref:Uncharacterized protein n=1 Tax=Desulfosporosinus acidiphilus (strain DSM 22704 / JCM 16185 / SJ4) TaxID=646529 RepID=I4D969_DESAJ|nr:hypothetical protein Desaci_3455 [Desulfosporosinus acidiphilus SJ4]